MSDINLSIVVPCFNEAENIPLLMERFAKSVNRNDVELIIVDNGSVDGTGDVVEKRLNEFKFAKLVKLEINKGYGGGIRAGLSKAGGKYIGWTHADMQTDPYDAVRALEIIESSPENEKLKLFIKGKRSGRPVLDVLFTVGMSVFETIYMGVSMNDINAQPNVFHRSFFDSWENAPDDFSLDLYAYYMAKKMGMTIRRFPVIFSKRRHGSSKWNTGIASRWKFIRRTVEYSIKLKREI